MNNKLVTFNLHHGLGEEIGKTWELAVLSISEGLRAIESRSHKLYKYLLDKSKENIKYKIIINGKNFYTDNPPDINNLEGIENCELRMINEKLETIDIVPVLEGAGSDVLGIFTAILGVALIIIGLASTFVTPWLSPALVTAGIGLLAAGIFTLLSKPPKFEDFREIEQGGKTSYLFSGPANVIGEGGPVPLGYGRLLVGSQVVSASYVIRDFSTQDINTYLRDEYGNLLVTPPATPPPPPLYIKNGIKYY